jgi:hypothetical protein
MKRLEFSEARQVAYKALSGFDMNCTETLSLEEPSASVAFCGRSKWI